MDLFLSEYFQPDEIGARCGWTVEITGVAISTGIEVALEGVEYVFYATVYFDFESVAKGEGVAYFCVEIEEVGSVDELVVLNVAERIVVGDFGEVGRVMRYVHFSGIYSRQSPIEVTPQISRQGEIAVKIRISWHVFSRSHRFVVAPPFGLFVSATLCGKSKLKRDVVAVGDASIDICTVDVCTVSVASFFDGVALLVVSDVLKNENVVESGEETFDEYVG